MQEACGGGGRDMERSEIGPGLNSEVVMRRKESGKLKIGFCKLQNSWNEG